MQMVSTPCTPAYCLSEETSNSIHALELAGCQCPLVWPTKEGEIWSRRLRNVPHQSHGPLRGSSKPHWKSSPNMELTARASIRSFVGREGQNNFFIIISNPRRKYKSWSWR